MKKIRWGILSTAKIAREKIIPAMQAGEFCSIDAIASRNKEAAISTAELMGIPKAYGTYEELLNDKDIDAVYIPLPNHLHVYWSIKALESNKHVLCEKPIGLSSQEAAELRNTSLKKPDLKIMEAFMYRFHPQWMHTKKLVQDGVLGTIKNIHSHFSYYNTDANNIRNQKETGGGSIMDIGCYCISLARFIFSKEPESVFANIEYDPVLKTDRMASGILQFNNGAATFTCSTQMTPYQRVNIFGTAGRIEIEIPFNAPPGEPTRIWLYTKTGREEIIFEAVDQYTLQGDLFSKSILNNTPLPYDLQDALNNMLVIEGVFKSSISGSWIKL